LKLGGSVRSGFRLRNHGERSGGESNKAQEGGRVQERPLKGKKKFSRRGFRAGGVTLGGDLVNSATPASRQKERKREVSRLGEKKGKVRAARREKVIRGGWRAKSKARKGLPTPRTGTPYAYTTCCEKKKRQNGRQWRKAFAGRPTEEGKPFCCGGFFKSYH